MNAPRRSPTTSTCGRYLTAMQEQARITAEALGLHLADLIGDQTSRCALCRAEVEPEHLVQLLEYGDQRTVRRPGFMQEQRVGHLVCPECASERPIVLLPVYDTESTVRTDTPVACAHLTDALIVADARFGGTWCCACETKVSDAELLRRGIDPNRPHGDYPAPTALIPAPYDPEADDPIGCYCERCHELGVAAVHLEDLPDTTDTEVTR